MGKRAPATTTTTPAISATTVLLNAINATGAVATPTARIPVSIAVLASITANPLAAAGKLPDNFAAFGGYVVTLTPKGAASSALQSRLQPTAKSGPCPFASALYTGQGQTLAVVWASVTATGHGQQGRGAGAYTAANALGHYTKSTGWFTLTKP